jgi:hypothetical protein
MPIPKRSWSLRSAPRDDGWLSIVEVSERDCVLSNGDTLLIRWGRLRMRCESLCREQAAVWIRTWPSWDWASQQEMPELIEIRRWSDAPVNDSEHQVF